MDLQELKQILRNQLAHLLVSVPETKDLVIDGDLTKPFDRVAGVSFLKKHGVDKIFKLDPTLKSLPGCSKRFYLVRSKMVTMKYIADHINSEKHKGEKRSYTVVMIPRKLHVCEMILEKEGVFGDVTVEEFPLDLIPLDRDILSLELPEFYRTFYLDGDQTWLHTVSASLVNLQNLFGKIPNVYCIGKGAKMAYDLMNTMFGLTGGGEQEKYSIGQLVIIDREIDYVTPVCSPMTYEALLDEIFKIDCSVIDLGPEVTGKEQVVQLLLTSEDEVFEAIRNRHFSNVFGFLSAKAKELQTGYDKKDKLVTVGDMKSFVANDLRDLKQQHKALAHHIGACEAIMKKKTKSDFEEYIKTEHSLLEGTETKENIGYIEECINKQFSMVLTLRLLCMLSQTQDGISSSIYKSLKTQFIQSYGFYHILNFYNLRRLGILTEQDPVTPGKPLTKGLAAMTRKSQYLTLSKKLSLVPKTPDDINLRSPNDMSYVFSGAYTPLTCKLVEQVLNREGFVGLEDVTKGLPGGTFADVKVRSVSVSGQKGKVVPSAPANPAQKTVLVYFLGGCTFSEIAALRYLSRTEGRYRIIIATTAIITGNSFLESVIDT